MSNLIRIPDTFDTAYQKQQLREYCEIFLPEVKLIRIDRDKTIVDDLYFETSDRIWAEPVTIKAYVEHQPTKKNLGKYGLDQTRDVMFHIPTVTLSDLGILENRDDFLIGDRLDWGGDVYEVKDQSRDTGSYWINTNIPFYLVLGADFYREET